MEALRRKLAALVLLAGVVGCMGGGGGDGDGASSGGNSNPIVPPEEGKQSCMEISILDDRTETPAQVEVFFQVEDCSGRPVRNLADGDFSIFEDGVGISRFESQHGIFCKAQRYRSYALLLLDMSQSVRDSDGGTGIEAVETAAMRFVDGLLRPVPDSDGNVHDVLVQRVAIYWFDGSSEIFKLVGFTGNYDRLTDAIESISEIELLDGSTNLHGAVVEGLRVLDRERDEAERADDIPFTTGALTVFTDGTDQAGRVSFTTAESAVLRSDNEVYTIGIGGEIDPVVLQILGKSGSVIVRVDPAQKEELIDEMIEGFEEIAANIDALANSFYLLRYCSPKRAGRHTLTLVATRGDETGQESTKFDADGFGPGCTKPEGTPLVDCAAGGSP